MKSLFKNKKTKIPTAPGPRASDEIQKEYADLLGKVGRAQYLIYAYTREMNTYNAQMEVVNQEFAARQALDKELSKQESIKTEGATNAQS